MAPRLVIILALTILIYAVEISVYGAWLAGVLWTQLLLSSAVALPGGVTSLPLPLPGGRGSDYFQETP